MRRVVVTGVGRGLGRALAHHCWRRGDAVVGTVRGDGIAADEPGFQIASGVDITNLLSIESFASLLGPEPIDVLINNAAMFEPDDWRDTEPEAIRRHFETNALGPFLVTRALAPKLSRGSKVVMISSGAASIGNARDDDCLSYRMSKVALNMMGRVLANGLAGAEATVVMIHPGSVATRMNPEGGLTPEEAAVRLASTIDRLTSTDAGAFLDLEGAPLPW